LNQSLAKISNINFINIEQNIVDLANSWLKSDKSLNEYESKGLEK